MGGCIPYLYGAKGTEECLEGDGLYMIERELRTPYVVGEDRCDHSYPILVTPTEAGSYYYARCLACLTRGPKRPSSRAARRALKEGVERLHQGSGSSLLLPI
jgi:hypothetical protein